MGQAASEALTQAEFIERIYLVLEALRAGDLSPRIRPWGDEPCDKVGQAMNRTLAHLSQVIGEVNRIQNEIGHLGQLGPQADVNGVQGDWKRMIDLVNQTAGNLTNQIRNFHRTVRAIEQGEHDFRASAPCHGELRQLRDALNRVIEKLGQEQAAPAGG